MVAVTRESGYYEGGRRLLEIAVQQEVHVPHMAPNSKLDVKNAFVTGL